MKAVIALLSTVLVFALAVYSGSTGLADDEAEKKNEKKETPPPATAEQEAWAKAGTPGKEHAALDPLAGNWAVTGTFWEKPGAPATETRGTSRTRWVLGRRFLQQDFEGEFMGMPFEGRGLIGYDNLKKRYVSTWVDTMSTAIYMSTGTADESGKVLTFSSTYTDPLTGKEVRSRDVTRIESPDRHVATMFHLQEDGSEFKTGELVFTRAPRGEGKKKAGEKKEAREKAETEKKAGAE